MSTENIKNLPVFTEKFLRTDTCRDTGILSWRNTRTQEVFFKFIP